MKNESKQYAQIIWEYMLMHHELEPSDAIIVLGSNDITVADRAYEVFTAQLAPYIICTGGNGKDSVFATSEAEVLTERLLSLGIPKEVILQEHSASNTGENAQFTRALLDELHYPWKKFILITKPYMERRSFATFSKQWPEGSFQVTSRPVSFEAYCTDVVARTSVDAFIETMVGDLQRIKVYPDLGFQIPQAIPAEVWSAYESLVSMGFTKYVIKD